MKDNAAEPIWPTALYLIQVPFEDPNIDIKITTLQLLEELQTQNNNNGICSHALDETDFHNEVLLIFIYCLTALSSISTSD